MCKTLPLHLRQRPKVINVCIFIIVKHFAVYCAWKDLVGLVYHSFPSKPTLFPTSIVPQRIRKSGARDERVPEVGKDVPGLEKC